jgi:uncharacterized protein (TIGR02246 family)
VLPPDPGHLADIEAIRRLKASYFRTVDTRDWEGFVELFDEDATLDGGNGRREGRDEIARVVSAVLDGVISVHHGHTPEIDVDPSGSEATGTWAMDDYLEWPAQSEQRGAPVGIRGYGHYRERYRKGPDGRWRFVEVILDRIRVDELAGGMPTR